MPSRTIFYVPTPNLYRGRPAPKDTPPRPVWHYPLAAAVGLFLVYCLLVGLFLGSQRSILFMPRIVNVLVEPPPNTTKVEVRTFDGERLLGFWRPPAPGMPVVVGFHDIGSAFPIGHRFANGAWGKAGWGVLAVAFRGYPGSTGSPTAEGLIEDGEAARAFVMREAPDAPMVFYGHGFGGAVATRMAELHEAKGLYLEAAQTSLRDYCGFHFRFLPCSLMSDKLWTEEWIAHVQAPVLIVQGDNDWLVPVSFARRLAAASEGSRLRIVSGKDNLGVRGAADAEAIALFAPGRR